MVIKNLPSTISNVSAEKILTIINVFETGSAEGKYGSISIYSDMHYHNKEYKQITYGRSQTTEFGNLKRLLEMYITNHGKYASEIAPFIPKIGIISNDGPQSLWASEELLHALKNAGNNDPIMRSTQDVFFDKYYFQPALSFFKTNGFTLPLSLLVIYDSYIHSGRILSFLRQRFEAVPPTAGGKEEEWIRQYTQTRHDWLIHHADKDVSASSYRTSCLQSQIANGNWDLAQAVKALGIIVN